MSILFTPEELVQYLYNEASPQKAAAIKEALEQDWTLREKLELLRSAADSLDKATDSPRTEVVLRVLNYARETAITESV